MLGRCLWLEATTHNVERGVILPSYIIPLCGIPTSSETYTHPIEHSGATVEKDPLIREEADSGRSIQPRTIGYKNALSLKIHNSFYNKILRIP